MKLISSSTTEPTSEALIHSLQDWWSLAGVEMDYAAQPAALLAATSPSPSVENAPPPVFQEPESEKELIAAPKTPMPLSHAEFVEWLANSDNLIEADWAKTIVLPQGPLEPEIMVVSALPEKTGSGTAALFNGQNQKLLENMLAAIGCDSDRAYLATIAVSTSLDGRIDDEYWPALKKRLIHHVGLVRPKRFICFGDLAAKILFGEDLLTARKNKQFINHGSSKTEAIVTFHPRILIERPLFKAEAWKDLQMLTRISAP